MDGFKFNAGGVLGSWAVLTIFKKMWKARPAEQKDTVEKTTAEGFHTFLKTMGITAPSPATMVEVEINGNDDPLIDMKIQEASQFAKLLLVMLPYKDTVLYKRIKVVGDLKVGIPTVCVLGNKFCNKRNNKGPDLQYFANVALKLNLKIGGTNQLLEVEENSIISQDKTMIVGIDVTHPSPGSAVNAPSVAGMVASVDRDLGQWPATLRIQQGRQEMVADLGSMLKSRLRLWMLNHKESYPDNILVYRDGVSEGQYGSVLESELPLLRQACTEVYPAPQTKAGLPRLTIVIVGKRHHTRFYPTKKGDADRKDNPKAGTVVDRGVTEARNWDFFMQAHDAIQGTARPAHYFVVLDEIFRRQNPNDAANMLEKLTHELCYMYGRATRAVSYCMPAYYADLVCDRARCYLSRMFDASASSAASSGGPVENVNVHPNLRDSMFYI